MKMFTDIINNITFDFTCNSEATAKNLQEEVLNFTAFQINTVISDVLTENADNACRRIAKIEIDLGNIAAKDVGSSYMLNKFKTLLTDEISKTPQAFYQDVKTNDASFTSLAAQSEVIKEFFLHGDLPWWVDKNSYPDIDKMLQKLINTNPEIIKPFFENLKGKKQVLQRIKSQCSSTAFYLIKNLVPGIFSASFFYSELPFLTKKIKINHIVAERLNDLKSFVNKKNSAAEHEVKVLLLHQLIDRLSISLLNKIKLLGVLSSDDLSELSLFINDKNSSNSKFRTIINLLQKLSFFQIEFLLLSEQSENEKTGVFKLIRGNTQFNNTGKQNNEDDLIPLKQKLIKSILKKSESKNQLLFHELNKYSFEDLLHFKKLFEQYYTKNNIKNKLVLLIAEHPYFAKYNLLQLVAGISFDSIASAANEEFASKELITQNEFEAFQAILHAVLNNLSRKETQIVKEVFAKGAIDNEPQKKVMVQLLKKLPEQCLQIITAFICLNEDEIKNIAHQNAEKAAYPLSFVNDSIPFFASQKVQKIIVENAGLCIIVPYLSALFNHLGYLENGNFKNKVFNNRALFLLQHIATGRQRNPEYLLQLNKLLCGLEAEEPAARYQPLTKKEKAEADDLIRSVIRNWKALKATSIQGFRTSFIQRKGILSDSENIWTLQVEKKGYDVLLDSIPWSFNLIKLPWMRKAIQAEW